MMRYLLHLFFFFFPVMETLKQFSAYFVKYKRALKKWICALKMSGVSVLQVTGTGWSEAATHSPPALLHISPILCARPHLPFPAWLQSV